MLQPLKTKTLKIAHGSWGNVKEYIELSENEKQHMQMHVLDLKPQ
jgi:hypothetical protein